jgi:hypothetical protein
MSYSVGYQDLFKQFHNIVESYSYQCHLPYIPEETQKKLHSYQVLIAKLLQLRNDILSQEMNSSLRTLYETWSKLYLKNDQYYHYQQQKAPQGTNNVIPSFENHRFLLSRITLLLSEISFHNNYDIKNYIYYLKESYIWYSKGTETVYRLAEIMKIQGINEERLFEHEYLLRKAIFLGTKLLSSGNIDSTSTFICSEDRQERERTKTYEKKEIQFAEKASTSLLLFLYQTNRSDQSDSLIIESKKYFWKINDQILNYKNYSFSSSLLSFQQPPGLPSIDINSENDKQMVVCNDSSDISSSSLSTMESPVYYIEDNFLTSTMLTHLQEIFNNDATFWKEHNYNHINSQSMISGYFSYLYPLKQRNAICSIEQLIDQIYLLLVSKYEIFNEVNVGKTFL